LKKRTGRKSAWIQREISEVFTVRPRIIEECNTSNSDQREVHWIEFFGALNPTLTNGTAKRDSRAVYLATTLDRQREQLAADRPWLAQFNPVLK
jgi:hypothetical protein